MLPQIKKKYGAFYTPEPVAEFLTNWAIRDRHDVVLDPSAGDGVFLLAARRRLLNLGATAPEQVRGVELVSETFERKHQEFSALSHPPRLIYGDFFDQLPEHFGTVTAVIGNPPFIRYQRFSGDVRQKALTRAAEVGVQLSELCSSWAPFLIHATRFIAPGGRMAVVAPAELTYAAYAKPVVQFLSESFAKIRILVFGKRLFSDVSEDTVLVLAEGKGQLPAGVTLHSLNDSKALERRDLFSLDAGESPDGWSTGVARLVEYFIPKATRDLYRELRAHADLVRLGDVSSVGIGYVTGNNDFFHLSAMEATELCIPQKYLLPSVRNARDITGLIFKNSDWVLRSERGERNQLLFLPSEKRRLPQSVSRYLARGIKEGVSKAYKCRTREPWYSVPHVYVADAFLTYMSGTGSKLFVNSAKAVAPNTLHVVRLSKNSSVTIDQLAAGWQSSLTQLSCEIEGHAMGGGMLKLEPRESGRVLVPALNCSRPTLQELDLIARRHGSAAVRAEVDGIMRTTIGISQIDLRKLEEATSVLRERRSER